MTTSTQPTLPRRGPAALGSIFLSFALLASAHAAGATKKFAIEEATIADIHSAILAKEITATEVVKLYLARIKVYNGPAVEEPYGLLGPVKTVPHAKGINALSTLNLRPAARKAWGFDERKARSMTDLKDDDPGMPDALEVAAKLDAEFAKTGKLVGPLHGVVMAFKDQYDTFDLRTTSGADAFYANDRPPKDSVFIARLRAAGAIILAKANLSEYADGIPRSSFGGTFANPYDTERNPGISSSGSGSSVGANLVTVAIAEETGSSIRGPAHMNNAVGISPTQELVPRTGMIQMGINTRVGPIARTVEDAARVLTVIAGYDPSDPLTAFAIGRTPEQPALRELHARNLAQGTAHRRRARIHGQIQIHQGGRGEHRCRQPRRRRPEETRRHRNRSRRRRRVVHGLHPQAAPHADERDLRETESRHVSPRRDRQASERSGCHVCGSCDESRPGARQIHVARHRRFWPRRRGCGEQRRRQVHLEPLSP
jgi:hypothetical protein